MIRHLRWKVVATNMLLISLVLLAVFAAVYFISRGNYHKNVQQQLYQALEQGDYGRSQPGMDSIPCFVAEVYGSGTVRVAGNSYYDLSDETRMAEIVTAALAADEDAGTLDEFHLRYLRQRGYTTTAIAFTDTYLEYTSLHTLLKACSLVGCGALVVLFLCSYLLSGVVTKPVGAAWAQQEQFLSSDKLPRIFDRFYRADDARTDGDSFGLGLPIAKAIVDAHRGVLRCDSSGGVTAFSISLPLTAGKQERGTDHV